MDSTETKGFTFSSVLLPKVSVVALIKHRHVSQKSPFSDNLVVHLVLRLAARPDGYCSPYLRPESQHQSNSTSTRSRVYYNVVLKSAISGYHHPGGFLSPWECWLQLVIRIQLRLCPLLRIVRILCLAVLVGTVQTSKQYDISMLSYVMSMRYDMSILY